MNKCPFCLTDWNPKPKLIFNNWMHRLLMNELPKGAGLTKEEEEA